jgi:uncharacterized membrane protein
VNQSFLIFLFRNFWRIVFGAAGLVFGLSWAIFGLTRTLFIVMLGVLGFYVGKWMDEGRPDGGLLRFLRKYFD